MHEGQPPADTARLWQSHEAAEKWREGADARDRMFAHATSMMLMLAKVGKGDRVLDVAAGTGDQTLMAARRVGPGGAVLATDIAAAMLAVAAEAAERAGLGNVETRVLDAQSLDLPQESFDAAISRFGLMFVADLHAALTGVRHALKPGKRFAAMVWGTPERNPAFAIPLAIAQRYAAQPPASPGQPGIFALGDGRRLAEGFAHAGFDDVQMHTPAILFRAPSARQFAEGRMVTGPFGALMAAMDDATRARTLAEITAALQQFEGAEGFIAPGEALIAVGTKANTG